MMVTLRLYRQHDLDLITLYRHPSFSLANAIKRSLMAYVRNEQLIIKQPDPYVISEDKISKTVQMHIYIDQEEDKDIIEWLKNTKEGYRNSVLKNIVRGYLAAPCIYSYQIPASATTDASRTNDLFNSNIKNISEIKGKGVSTRKKSNKKDNRKVEDSELAKEILNRQTVKATNTDTVFVERIKDDDEEVPDVLKEPKQKVTPIENNEEQINDEDMFDMFNDMMNSM